MFIILLFYTVSMRVFVKDCDGAAKSGVEVGDAGGQDSEKRQGKLYKTKISNKAGNPNTLENNIVTDRKPDFGKRRHDCDYSVL